MTGFKIMKCKKKESWMEIRVVARGVGWKVGQVGLCNVICAARVLTLVSEKGTVQQHVPVAMFDGAGQVVCPATFSPDSVLRPEVRS